MRNAVTVARKELGGYLNSYVGYIVIVAFLMMTSYLFFFPMAFFLQGQASLRNLFTLLPWTLVLFVPPLTMHLFAEEKKLGTIEVLMTLPIRDHEAVLGKFLGAFAFVLVLLGLTVSLPISVAWLGNPDPGPVIGGYLGAVLLAAAYVAIGLFVSSLTENQIVAAILSVVVLLALVLIGTSAVVLWLPTALAPVFQYLSVQTHFDSLGRGVIDTRDVVYFLSLVVFFLSLSVWSVESRKWR